MWGVLPVFAAIIAIRRCRYCDRDGRGAIQVINDKSLRERSPSLTLGEVNPAAG
jgi:hypothetical protein